jgi:hypothetical protein
MSSIPSSFVGDKERETREQAWQRITGTWEVFCRVVLICVGLAAIRVRLVRGAARESSIAFQPGGRINFICWYSRANVLLDYYEYNRSRAPTEHNRGARAEPMARS